MDKLKLSGGHMRVHWNLRWLMALYCTWMYVIYNMWSCVYICMCVCVCRDIYNVILEDSHRCSIPVGEDDQWGIQGGYLFMGVHI
jgi:hypothetical protein